MNYQRVLLKISGNFFSGKSGEDLNFNAIENIAQEILNLHKKGLQIAIVNGAGNIFRGRSRPDGFDQTSADKIGIISTLPNSMALTEILNNYGVDACLMCSFEIAGIARRFNALRARKLLSQNKVLVLTGGTGHPFFSTDTAAVLRALEIKADILLKATDVDGVYSADPQTDSSAVKFDQLTYKQALDKNLQVMDQTAFALAQENRLKILVFKFEKGSLIDILENPSKGTLISTLS